jgi:hypothetical protein
MFYQTVIAQEFATFGRSSLVGGQAGKSVRGLPFPSSEVSVSTQVGRDFTDPLRRLSVDALDSARLRDTDSEVPERCELPG